MQSQRSKRKHDVLPPFPFPSQWGKVASQQGHVYGLKWLIPPHNLQSKAEMSRSQEGESQVCVGAHGGEDLVCSKESGQYILENDKLVVEKDAAVGDYEVEISEEWKHRLLRGAYRRQQRLQRGESPAVQEDLKLVVSSLTDGPSFNGTTAPRKAISTRALSPYQKFQISTYGSKLAASFAATEAALDSSYQEPRREAIEWPVKQV